MSQDLQRSGAAGWLLDPYRPTADRAEAEHRYSGGSRSWTVPAIAGGVLLLLAVVGWLVDAPQFYFSYLIGWLFCVSVSLGAIFFVVIQHLTRAKWSVVVRRIAETLGAAMPLLAVLSIPIFIGMHDLYHWTHVELLDPASPDFDPIVAGKTAYLNTPFFIARAIIYFVAWSYIGTKLYSLSLRQDVSSDHTIPARQRKLSAWGLAVLAVTISFASFDFMMSTDPHWFSTIFGVYLFSGSFWVSFAAIVAVALLMQRIGAGYERSVTIEHYHDLGKFMYGFTVFWAYIAFSQYMLIWYGNIPEETIWYRHRLEGGWEYHSLILLVFHFILPFIILLPRFMKRNRTVLGVMAVWFFVMHWFDLHWIVMPVHSHTGGFHWIDFAAWLGLFGVMAGVVLYRLARHSLIPRNDPYLAESLHFENI